MKMIVAVGEVWTRKVVVEVESGKEEDAIKMVEAGNGQRLDLEYSHTLPSAAWSTEEAVDVETGSRSPTPPQREDSKKKKGRTH